MSPDPTFEISNPDRVYFPATALREAVTKGDVLAHYQLVAPAMLPALEGRPLIVQRFPRGIGQKGFYQKNAPKGLPASMETAEINTNDGVHTYPVVRSVDDILWFANKGAIVFHQWMSRMPDLTRADEIMFDLDPSTDEIGPVIAAAKAVREVLERVGFSPSVKATGSRGLHLSIRPAGGCPNDQARAFAMLVAQTVAAEHPNDFTVEFRKKNRQGRLFLDVLRNGFGAHGVAPWSLRANARASVAVPLTWEEALSPALDPGGVTIGHVAERIAAPAVEADTQEAETQTVEAAAQLLLPR